MALAEVVQVVAGQVEDGRGNIFFTTIIFYIMKPFQEKVIEVVKAIPKGSVLTYKEVAKHAGNASASRAVGGIMAKNQDKNVPCHRVVRSDGSIGWYNSLQGRSKLRILIGEGVEFNKNGKVLLN